MQTEHLILCKATSSMHSTFLKIQSLSSPNVPSPRLLVLKGTEAL